ncbi:(+)-delta-cadinene synthase isozyme XC14 [Hibiscus syriacus]|uniref:(+)-delta-cadinene synthase n=1 Tax=Hibiscus syriacus TaxID=106335 RepID=A0A6A3ARJ5_HIBSY|nr:(+)-delta-cadinene synthase isozyme A-like [Hibiscus syriacus]KAE8706538.1 (+)-delta-cadinene synthase isozyme XC14 [Hibiscus syriacus]
MASTQVSQVPASPLSVLPSDDENRPKADFHPGIWGDMFLQCPVADIDAATELQYEELKEEVRKMIVEPADDSNQKLPLIDAVKRLGVSYHFEKEIEDELEKIYHDIKTNEVADDLYTTALRFRLLREHGFHVSSDAFNKFKDEEGNFKASLRSDVRGLLELYEASYMRVHGEDILDEAISFTAAQLTLALPTLDHPLSEQVDHALKQSIRRGLPRVEARKFISIYEEVESHNKQLLQFAKIDFNLVQLLHRKELSEICRWWKDLDFTRKLPFARDRVVEGYFWIMGVYFEPQYSLGRKFLTKVIAMASIVDDTYDSFATYDELIPYTDAIERWDLKCMDQLPEYMKISYKALLDVYEEMEQLLTDQGRQYRVEYARKAMIRLAQAYLLEAKWTHQNYKPTFEEFRENALPTSGYAMLAITAFVGMGDIITPETFEWAANDPNIIKASTIICRFMDDIAEHKFKHRREDDCSAIECYMEQYGVTAQEAYDEFNKHIESSWKDVNEEFLKPTEMPTPVLSRSLNLARVMDVLYREGDGYTHVGKAAKGGITSLLIDPIAL